MKFPIVKHQSKNLAEKVWQLQNRKIWVTHNRKRKLN